MKFFSEKVNGYRIKPGAKLRDADLFGADFRGAKLRDADLFGADFRGADLRDADLFGADLREANLSGADLREANLAGADLVAANLSMADLREANLAGADLVAANLSMADLSRADLSYTDLEGANLVEADINGANTCGIENKFIWTFQIGRHFGYYADGFVTIGCETKSLSQWLKEYKQIGRDNAYSDEDIRLYGAQLKLIHAETKNG